MGIEKGKKGLYEATGSWGGKKNYAEMGVGGGGGWKGCDNRGRFEEIEIIGIFKEFDTVRIFMQFIDGTF